MLLHEFFIGAAGNKEFVIEGTLSHAELGKHYGRYLGMFIDKINNNEPFEVTSKSGKRVELGDQVLLDQSSINAILQAYFGQNKLLDVGEIKADNGGKIIPLGNPNKVILKTQAGGEVTIGQLQKPPEFGSQKGFNTGQIAEGALGADVAEEVSADVGADSNCFFSCSNCFF
jgi:hypothetical protein